MGPIADLQDVPFEPAIFAKIIAEQSLVVVAWILFCTCSCLVDAFAALGMGNGQFRPSFHPLLLMAVALGLPYLLQRFSPTYYRIVPGRLDILRGSFLRSRFWVHQRFDLKSTRITVRFNGRYVHLVAPDSKPVRLTLSNVDDPYRFVEFLFRAAVCTHPAPPVPDDALLG